MPQVIKPPVINLITVTYLAFTVFFFITFYGIARDVPKVLFMEVFLMILLGIDFMYRAKRIVRLNEDSIAVGKEQIYFKDITRIILDSDIPHPGNRLTIPRAIYMRLRLYDNQIHTTNGVFIDLDIFSDADREKILGMLKTKATSAEVDDKLNMFKSSISA